MIPTLDKQYLNIVGFQAVCQFHGGLPRYVYILLALDQTHGAAKWNCAAKQEMFPTFLDQLHCNWTGLITVVGLLVIDTFAPQLLAESVLTHAYP